MAKFRKRPIAIEAKQIQVHMPMPFEGEAEYHSHPLLGAEVKTLEGWYQVHTGDWIIKGIQGEFYPIKADIFEETYEVIDG